VFACAVMAISRLVDVGMGDFHGFLCCDYLPIILMLHGEIAKPNLIEQNMIKKKDWRIFLSFTYTCSPIPRF
jgi:hypothetical protein